ncbi:cold shock domain-containing protein (plasmid) [Halarchaeum sp. CBA1220]|uniref:cold shock domain-containing protein n=1 Tax=Halarchaeum sp. CBA1220 TaxID=1853682 RepID=UPI001314486D|nr:cold shock domain-containing protein [Halarchaeum sp. CBA1220]QLC35557.1 cold shock domain-containing protein [Halarchaeum sp. CBA1220]
MTRWSADTPRTPDLSTVASPDHRSIDHGDLSKEDRLGRGGNADVFRVSLAGSETPAALKEPRLQQTITEETFRAFNQEAKRWSKIDDHEHVVGVVDWGSRPVPWIALEYMDGGSLRARFDEAETSLDLAEALWIGICLCRAVRYAHRHGIAHLDLKPSNVLFRETAAGTWDVPKVTDWGLATFLTEHSGSIDGLSPAYAAPEQFDTDEYGDPSDFTDIYQLGCVLFECLTGEPPFAGSGSQLMYAHLNDEAPAPTDVDPSVPEELDRTIRCALSKHQHDRQETVVELRRDLEAAFDRVVDKVDTRDGEGGDSESETVPLEAASAQTDVAATPDDPSAADRHTGTVDFFNETGGYGYITTDTVDEEVFFHMEDVGGSDLEEEQKVEFGVEEAEKGPRATNVTRLNTDESAATDTTGTADGALVDGTITGTVDFFNETGGYGFITTDAVDEEVFFHMDDVGGPDLEEGQRIGFTVEEADKGPRATNVTRLNTDDSEIETAGAAASDGALVDGTVTGTVDFFNETGGYGFITTDAVDEEVFFHMDDVGGPDLEEGQKVEFTVEEADKGPRTTNATRLNTDESAATDTAGTADGTLVDGTVTGTVDSFNDIEGDGLIVTDAVDEDVYFQMEDVGGPDLEEGQRIEFTVEESKNGPRAKNIRRL